MKNIKQQCIAPFSAHQEASQCWRPPSVSAPGSILPGSISQRIRKLCLLLVSIRQGLSCWLPFFIFLAHQEAVGGLHLSPPCRKLTRPPLETFRLRVCAADSPGSPGLWRVSTIVPREEPIVNTPPVHLPPGGCRWFPSFSWLTMYQ